MTDAELDKLINDIAAEIAGLPADTTKPLTGRERKHRAVLLARQQALEIIKSARKSGNIRQEEKASVDYALLTEYGERNFLLYNFMKARLGGMWW